MFYRLNLNVLVISCLLTLFLSCNRTKKDVYDDIKGSWAIYSIAFKGENYKNHIFSMNILNFKKDYSLSIPEIDNYKKEDNAQWKFDYKNDSIILIIESNNKVLNDTYKAFFYENENVDKLEVLKSTLEARMKNLTEVWG